MGRSLIVGASMGSTTMGRSIVFASMGSTTMGRYIVVALNGLYHNGQINDIFCLNGPLYYNGYRMLLFCPTTMGRLFIVSLFCVTKGFTGVVSSTTMGRSIIFFASMGRSTKPNKRIHRCCSCFRMHYDMCDVVYYLCRSQNHISCKKHVCIQLETLTSLGKLSTDKNSTPGPGDQVLRQQSHHSELASTFCLLVIRHYL